MGSLSVHVAALRCSAFASVALGYGLVGTAASASPAGNPQKIRRFECDPFHSYGTPKSIGRRKGAPCLGASAGASDDSLHRHCSESLETPFGTADLSESGFEP